MKKLAAAELDLIHACLLCVAAGHVIDHDAEFSALFGLTPAAFVQIAAAWPEFSGLDPADVHLAINGAFNNLLGYPHRYAKTLETILPASRVELERVFVKWRQSTPQLRQWRTR